MNFIVCFVAVFCIVSMVLFCIKGTLNLIVRSLSEVFDILYLEPVEK